MTGVGSIVRRELQTESPNPARCDWSEHACEKTPEAGEGPPQRAVKANHGVQALKGLISPARVERLPDEQASVSAL